MKVHLHAFFKKYIYYLQLASVVLVWSFLNTDLLKYINYFFKWFLLYPWFIWFNFFFYNFITSFDIVVKKCNKKPERVCKNCNLHVNHIIYRYKTETEMAYIGLKRLIKVLWMLYKRWKNCVLFYWNARDENY